MVNLQAYTVLYTMSFKLPAILTFTSGSLPCPPGSASPFEVLIIQFHVAIAVPLKFPFEWLPTPETYTRCDFITSNNGVGLVVPTDCTEVEV
jgi:hypothetical protein